MERHAAAFAVSNGLRDELPEFTDEVLRNATEAHTAVNVQLVEGLRVLPIVSIGNGESKIGVNVVAAIHHVIVLVVLVRLLDGVNLHGLQPLHWQLQNLVPTEDHAPLAQ